jgi:hypothetical protein
MRSFYKTVDKSSRKDMTAYLSGHFRYDTMNPWNGSTSYACNLKTHTLGFERSIEEKLYDMLKTTEYSEALNDQLYRFGEEHNFNWQAALNGRLLQ